MNALDVLGATNRSQNASDRFAEAVPFRVFGGKLFASGGRETVEAGAAIVGGGAPLSVNPALLQKALERGIKRAMLDFEGLAGGLLDEFGDAVAVHGTPAEGAKNDEVESALHNFQAIGGS